jgi:hypothetical protein
MAKQNAPSQGWFKRTIHVGKGSTPTSPGQSWMELAPGLFVRKNEYETKEYYRAQKEIAKKYREEFKKHHNK